LEEILKRFSIVLTIEIDLFIENRNYLAPLCTIKAVLKLCTGMQWVQETVHLQGVPIAVNHMDGSRGKSASSLKYKIQLQPVFEIANIQRKFTSSKKWFAERRCDYFHK
jgi:hypothetical protein